MVCRAARRGRSRSIGTSGGIEVRDEGACESFQFANSSSNSPSPSRAGSRARQDAAERAADGSGHEGSGHAGDAAQHRGGPPNETSNTAGNSPECAEKRFPCCPV
jgi:hypothetical protein